MALIKCPECGNEISDMAKTCPNCGIKIRKVNNGYVKYLIIGVLILIVAIIGIALIVNLFNGKPANMDKNTYNLGTSALAITDDYMDVKITKDEARSKLETISNRLDKTYAIDKNDIIFGVKIEISSVSTYILLDNLVISSKSYSKEVLDARNALAVSLNKSAR